MKLSAPQLKTLWAIWALTLAVLGFYAFRPLGEGGNRPRIYDESADASKEIAEALVLAKKENKRVLLQFGANWCGWCHRLHQLFESDRTIRKMIRKSYVVVMVDVSGGHNSETVAKYGNPTQFGLPVFIVLNSTSNVLVTQDTGAMVTDGQYDPKKVRALLETWRVR